MSELLDNRRHRIEALKEIIKSLHDGADPASLKEEFGELLAEVGPTEIAAMENSLMADGMAQTEIQRMCDVHAAVLAGDSEDFDSPEIVRRVLASDVAASKGDASAMAATIGRESSVMSSASMSASAAAFAVRASIKSRTGVTRR